VKVIQMTKHGGPEVLHFVELADPKPGLGEVLLKVDAAAVVATPGDGVDPGSARPAANPLPLADAGEARRLMEAAAIAGNVVMKP
jgi:hypothetical protein